VSSRLSWTRVCERDVFMVSPAEAMIEGLAFSLRAVTCLSIVDILIS
jgi:hypothetical protein